MSEHHAGPVETGAQMNYAEHEKTYDLFIAGSKYCTALLVALLIGMAAGFLGGAGFFGGLLIFVVLSAAGIFLLR
ncbi:aa3-type cytochrome c oxidase subunit IV [Rhizobium sp. ACO-34A]|nr:aa3-type cytochrome c oxidase subunit IV [Rhizobium sp. ACO-34A]ATN35511.1 aa3-type cytochrome c oxidase subunit IV [Rhizobium sp. ACO-34A]